MCAGDRARAGCVTGTPVAGLSGHAPAASWGCSFKIFKCSLGGKYKYPVRIFGENNLVVIIKIDRLNDREMILWLKGFVDSL